MKKSDIKQYYVEDYIYVNHEPCSVSKEMWTAQEIIECLINRTHMGYEFDLKVKPNDVIDINNFI